MLIYAGIDEAGYGPMLGPLCIAATVFALPNHDPADGAPDLWKLLHGHICRARRDAGRRICIADSKQLKGQRSSATHPLLHLERGVLSMLPGGVEQLRTIRSDRDLLEALGIDPECSIEAPWYGTSTPLPLAHQPDELRILTSRLARGLDQTGVQCEVIRCCAIDAEPFNARLDQMGSKAAINMQAVLQLIEMIRTRYAGHHPRVIVDRQGGRTHYLRELQLAWPESHVHILAERDAISRYRLVQGTSELTVSFVREAEQHHLPVALASMTAKYVRELLMERLNRFFREHMPELKPTAGYVQDGRRFVKDITPVMKRLRIERRTLIRSS